METVRHGKLGGCEWSLDNTGQLIIEPISFMSAGFKAGKLEHEKGEGWPWNAFPNEITFVTIYPGIKAPEHMEMIFSGLRNVECVAGFHNLDTSKVKDLSYAFAGCSNMTYLEMSDMDFSSLECANGIFSNCASLEEVNYYGTDISAIHASEKAFEGSNIYALIDSREEVASR